MQREHLLRKRWIVNRTRIHAMLSEGLGHPLICVVAGPGYGKTTAVADFCRNIDRRLIWVHLLPMDNDPQRFWRKFLDELKYELPDVEKTLSDAGMTFPDTLELFDDFLRIITEEGYRNDDVLLVFDNLESVESEAVLGFIASLSRVELENLCVILISNVWPTIKKQAGIGKHYYIDVSDLCFSDEETVRLFSYYGRQLTRAELKRLCEYTGRWPLPLYLIASQSDGTTRFDFGGTLRLSVIVWLFEQNYYANFSEEMRRLLVKISILPSVNAELVRAIDAGRTPGGDPALLDNIFISYNYSRKQLYLQNMYQEFLTSKSGILTKAEVASLYAVAGDWYKQHKYYREALECYWRIRDYDSFLCIVSAPPGRWVNNGFTNWILEILNHFPAEYCAEHEEVDFFRGLLYVNDAQIGRAKDILLSLIARLTAREELPPGKRALLGNLYALMVDISVIQNNLEGLDYAPMALDVAPGGVCIRTEEMAVAGNNEVFFLHSNEPGSLKRMYDYAERMDAYSERLHHRNGRGYFDLFMAEASFLCGNAPQTWEYSAKAIHLAKHACQHDIVADAFFLQMRLSLFLGDGARAESLLGELAAYVEENAPHELVGVRDCALAFFYVCMHDSKNIPFWLVENGNLPTDIPLEIGRDRIICALSLYSEGSYEEAYNTLLELDGFYREKRQWCIQLGALILKAACLLKMHDTRAVEMLYRAYDMTWQNGIVACFVELGRDMLDLLEAAEGQSAFDFDPLWVATVRDEAADFLRRQAIMHKQYGPGSRERRKKIDKLTPREAKVFSCWSKGLSRDEIAGLLGISVRGVKKHLTNIYLKLGAVNRLDAIHIAIANGLLERSA